MNHNLKKKRNMTSIDKEDNWITNLSKRLCSRDNKKDDVNSEVDYETKYVTYDNPCDNPKHDLIVKNLINKARDMDHSEAELSSILYQLKHPNEKENKLYDYEEYLSANYKMTYENIAKLLNDNGSRIKRDNKWTGQSISTFYSK